MSRVAALEYNFMIIIMILLIYKDFYIVNNKDKYIC